MVNIKFEKYKLERSLKRCGIKCDVYRTELNEFGEPDNNYGSVQYVCTISGIYHEENSNIQITMGDTTQVRTKKIPMLLCKYNDFIDFECKVGDFIIINEKRFKIVGIVNIQEWSIIGDISLEVFDDGNKD